MLMVESQPATELTVVYNFIILKEHSDARRAIRSAQDVYFSSACRSTIQVVFSRRKLQRQFAREFEPLRNDGHKTRRWRR